MLIKKPDDIKSSEITPEKVYLNRRNFMKGAALVGSAAATAGLYRWLNPPPPVVVESDAVPNVVKPSDAALTSADAPTPYSNITTYNNYYEFGTDKYSPARLAHTLTTRPWTVEVGGLVNKPKTFDIEELLKFEQEERIYRFRCVEGWSMVIPWVGFSLKTLLDKVEPLGTAKYVAFETLLRPAEMPNQRVSYVLDFPYVEGLRLDEAMHPLTILATGIYGKIIPNQNGAPLRLVVPWKYGFKSIKSIVKITLTDKEPPTTWNLATPSEYGFYSNVNPNVAHPRWSQAAEQRIGELSRIKTLMFNGYGDQVAKLYEGMDLKRFY
jgi:methionine sulfoxide reductase catalytic subunit